MENTVAFLFKEDPAKARQLMVEFERVGLKTPMKFGERESHGLDNQNGTNEEEREKKRLALLLEVAIAALDRAVSLFDEIITRVIARLRRAEHLKMIAAVITTVLSSGVVAALVKDPTSWLTLPLGLLAVLSSVATVIAGRFRGW